MDLHSRRHTLRTIGAFVCLITLASPAWSQEFGRFAKEGGFVGLSFLPRFTFDGVTFDGESIYKEVGGEEFMILPRLTEKDMFRVMLGYRGPQASLELSYDRSRHAGTFLEGTGEAVFQAVNVDGRFFFATAHRIQPYVLVGGAIPWFTVKDGSFLDPNVGDATFNGYGLNTEAGVTVYPHRQIGVSVGYNYRVLYFDDVRGVSETEFRLRPRFNERSGALAISTHVIF
jgi:hypothetical protein